jgi:hypothetical protein
MRNCPSDRFRFDVEEPQTLKSRKPPAAGKIPETPGCCVGKWGIGYFELVIVFVCSNR